MFFQVNSVKVSLAEYLYEGGILLKPIVLLFALFVKLFRIQLPSSTDIPPVQSLTPFKTTQQELPGEIAASLAEMDQQLRQAGFELTDALSINHSATNTQYASLVYRSPSGDTIAWLRDRHWPQLPRSSRFPRVNLYSRGQNGKTVMTSSANRDLLDPPDWDVEYQTRSPVKDLLQSHRLHLSSVMGAQRPQDVGDALTTLDQLHHQFVQFQTERGVFSEPETPVVSTSAEDASDVEIVPAIPADDMMDPGASVVREVRRLETKRTQWLTKLFVLVISVAFFVGLGAAQWDLKLVLMLVPILFVHELGHYVAMIVFGYKNVQMFYIPLLGAAVTGRHYGVAGWRKAVVSLAGPLPSIVIGFFLGIVGILLKSELIINASILTLILNAFNLLPFLPLDGGWVAHVTLFARSQLLDLLFRVATVLTLLVASIAFGDRVLMFFGIAMAIGIPIVWKTIKATEIARGQMIPEPSNDQIPEIAIRKLVPIVEEAGIPAQSDKQIAQAVVNVYESVMTKPPSWPATLGLWALHIGGVVMALIGCVGLAMATLLSNEMFDLPEFQSQYVEVELTEGQFRLGTGPLPATDLLMWDYPDEASAQGAFEQLRDTSDDSTARLGRLVFASRMIEAGVGDVEDFEADALGAEADYAINAERQSRLDDRFAAAPPADRQRAFGSNLWGYPALLVSFADAEQAERIIDEIEFIPEPMDDRFPIAPWTPKREITPEQLELRRLLAILEGTAEDVPWQVLQPDPEDMEFEVLSNEGMQELMEDNRRLHEQNQQRRKEWIEQEQQSAEGARLALLQAYTKFETELQAWRGKIESAGPTDDVDWLNSPNLLTHVQPLLDDLGYLDPNDDMQRFAAMTSAMPVSVDDFIESPPLTGSLIQIDLYEAQDVAAAFGGLMGWLKKNDATGIVWMYDEALLPEDVAVDEAL